MTSPTKAAMDAAHMAVFGAISKYLTSDENRLIQNVARAVHVFAAEQVQAERARVEGILCGCEGACAVREEPCNMCLADCDTLERIRARGQGK